MEVNDPKGDQGSKLDAIKSGFSLENRMEYEVSVIRIFEKKGKREESRMFFSDFDWAHGNYFMELDTLERNLELDAWAIVWTSFDSDSQIECHFQDAEMVFEEQS